jgi:hypothetical protein
VMMMTYRMCIASYYESCSREDSPERWWWCMTAWLATRGGQVTASGDHAVCCVHDQVHVLQTTASL